MIDMHEFCIATNVVPMEDMSILSRRLMYYIASDKKVQKRKIIDGYGSAWQNVVLEDPEKLQNQLNHDVDAAFTALAIVNAEYHKQTGRYILQKTIGKPRKMCTQEEWESYRFYKAEALDDVVSFCMMALAL